VHAAAVARLDQQLHVGVHERHRHGDGTAVRQHEGRVVAEALDDAEDVVPAAAVEAGAVVAQLVYDLVHLKGGQDGLDQHGAADGAALHADVVLGQIEDVVPQAGLEVRLHLGQVEVGPCAALDQLGGVVKEVEAKVEQAAGNGFAVNGEVLLVQMPTASTADERRQAAVGAQTVPLVALLEVDLAADGVVKVELAVDHVVPCRGGGVWLWSDLRSGCSANTHPRSRPCRSTRPS
jgi:hypothetical protein